LGFILPVAALTASAHAALPGTDITAEQVRAFLASAPHGDSSDKPMRVVDVGGYRFGVYAAFRPKNAPTGGGHVHRTRVAEIYYMLDGAGVLVTGGKLREPLEEHPSALGNWTDVSGPQIDGGVSRRLTKGDLVIIPGGTPHTWVSQESDMTYLILRPDPNNEIALK
jgi:mannose-6-phosphate isomerase-like protein (cupin superfamily)